MRNLVLILLLFVVSISKSEILYFEAYDKEKGFEILLDSIKLVCDDGRLTILVGNHISHYKWDKTVYVNDSYKNNKIEIGKNYPNPFNDVTFINISSDSETNISLKVYSILGKLVYSENNQLHSGQSILQVDLNLLNEGIYFATIEVGEKIFTHKLIKSSCCPSYPNVSDDSKIDNNVLSLISPEDTKYTFIAYASGYENDTMKLNVIKDFEPLKFYLIANEGTIYADSFSIELNLPNSVIKYHYEYEQGSSSSYDTTTFNSMKFFNNVKVDNRKIAWSQSYEDYDDFYHRRFIQADIDTLSKSINNFHHEFPIDSNDAGATIYYRHLIKLTNIPCVLENNKIYAYISGEQLRDNLQLIYNYDNNYFGSNSKRTIFKGVLDFYEDSYFKIWIKLKE